MRAVFQPAPKLGAVFEHSRLHVNLLRLIPAEGEVKARERTLGEHSFKLLLIEEVALLLLVAEEEPVLSLRLSSPALFEKGAERRDASAGSDHDDWLVAVGGQAEPVRDLDEHRDGRVGVCAVGKEGRANAFAGATVAFVAHGGNGEMHLARMRLGAGGNGVEPRLELGEQANKFLRSEFRRRTAQQQIDDFATVKKLVEVSLARGFKQGLQFRVAGFLSHRLQEGTPRLRDLKTAEQCAAE